MSDWYLREPFIPSILYPAFNSCIILSHKVLFFPHLFSVNRKTCRFCQWTDVTTVFFFGITPYLVNRKTWVTDRSVPFLPVNPGLSAVRNQGRQKLARFNAREFATLIIDILNDARRRQMGVSPGGRLTLAGEAHS